MQSPFLPYTLFWFGDIQKFGSLKISKFWTPLPCPSQFILHVPMLIRPVFCIGPDAKLNWNKAFKKSPHNPPPPPATPSQKQFRDVYTFLNEKSRNEKRENNYFFANSTWNICAVIYIMTIKIQVHKKTLNEKNV